MGVLTNPGLGHGYIELEELKRTLAVLVQFYRGFGGVMGWEYYNSKPGDESMPWLWATTMLIWVDVQILRMDCIVFLKYPRFSFQAARQCQYQTNARMAGDQHHELRLPCGLAAKDGHTRDTALSKHILVG